MDTQSLQLYEQRLQFLQNQLLKYQSENTQLSTQISNLSSQNTQYQHVHDAVFQKQQIWDKKQIELEKEIVVLKGQVVTGQSFTKLKDSMIKMKDQTNQNLQKEVQELKKQLKDKDSQQSKLQSSTEQSTSTELLRAKIHSLELLLAQSDETIKSQKENYHTVEISIQEKDLKISELVEQNQKSEGLIQEFKEQMETLKNESQEMISQIRKQREGLVAQHDTEKAQASEVHQKLQDEYEEKIANLLREQTILKEQLQNEIIDKDLQKTQLVNMSNEIQNLQHQLNVARGLQGPLGVKIENQQNQDGFQLDSLRRLIERQMKQFSEQSTITSDLRKKEIDYTFKICQLQEENQRLVNENKRLIDLEELQENIKIMELELQEANQINQTMSTYYKQSQKEVKNMKQQIQQQEALLNILRDQYSELQKEVPLIESEKQMKELFYQLHLRCTIILRSQFQNSQNQIDQKDFMDHLKEIEKSKLQEKLLLENLIKSIQKGFAQQSQSIQSDSRLEKIFLYLEEQLQLLREQKLKQDETFQEIKDSIHKPDKNPIIEALNQQIQVLESQVTLLQSSQEQLLNEQEQMRNKVVKLEEENNQKSKRLLEYRLDAIKIMKDYDLKISEHTALTLQVKELTRTLTSTRQDLQDSQSQLNHLTNYIQTLSIIGTEFQKATLDENLSKLLREQNILINELRVKEVQQRERILELEGSIDIVKENYQCMRSQILERAYLKNQNDTDQEMKDETNQKITTNQEIQTIPQLDSDLLELLAHDYTEIEDIMTSYQSQIDQLIKLFYAYSRLDQNEAGDNLAQQYQQKEQEYQDKQKLIEQEVDRLKTVTESQKSKLETQHRVITQMQQKLKINAQTGGSGTPQVQPQIQQQVPQQAVPQPQSSRVVVNASQQQQQTAAVAQSNQQIQQLQTQLNQLQQQNQLLQTQLTIAQNELKKTTQQLNDLQKSYDATVLKLQESEQTAQRIMNESSFNMRQFQQRNKELKSEVERLQGLVHGFEGGSQAINQGSQLTGNVVVGKLMKTLQKSKNLMLALMEDKPELQDLIAQAQQVAGVTAQNQQEEQ
eukprot:403359348